MWSGFWNFLGVYTGGIAVAMGIVNLLPIEALVEPNVSWHCNDNGIIGHCCNLESRYMVFRHSLFQFAYAYRIYFRCWMAYMLLPGAHSISMNWGKVQDTGLSLLISPVFGFGLAMGLMLPFKSY